MRIACLQFAPQLGDVDQNLNRADSILSKANPKDIDLLVLPELAFSGYNFKSLKDISPYLEPTAVGISSLWARTTALKYNCVVIVGYPEKVDITPKWPASPQYYSSAITVNKEGETITNYRKSFLYYTDEAWASEGPDGFYDGVIEGLGNVAIGICMDLNPYKFEAPWSAWEFAYHILHKQANIAIISMAWVTREDARSYGRAPNEPDMEALAYWVARLEPLIRGEDDGELIVVLANRSGTEGDATYAGTSAVLGIQSGEVKLYGVLGRGERELLVVDTSKRPQAKLVSDPSIPARATGISRESGYASLASKQLLKEGSNDLDTKSIASLERHVASDSSLNPAGVGGAAKELAEILWDNEEIRQYVKLGFVAMDLDRFERNFLRLMKSYASELRAEADTTIQKRATRIVYNYRAYVTRIIRRRVVEDDGQATAFHSIKDQSVTKLTLERFLAQQQSTDTPNEEDTQRGDEQEINEDSHSDDEDPYLPNLEKLTDFLVLSTAFKNFKARLKTLVKSNSQLQQTLEGSPSQSSHIEKLDEHVEKLDRHVEKLDEHVPIDQPKDPDFLRRVKNFLPTRMTAISQDSGYASIASKQLLKGSNDLDTKSIASLESYVSSVSSLNPADVGGAAEEFAEILWDNKAIRQCVELGFVAMDSDRFERNFLRLMKNYASELREEADTTIQKRATRIVYNYRAYVTRIIRRRVVEDDGQATAFHSIKDQSVTKLTLERFLAQQQPTDTPNEENTQRGDEQEINEDSPSDDEDPYLPNLEKLTDFLVSSTAFKNFKAQLEAFVKSNSQLQQTLEGSPFQSHIEKLDEHVEKLDRHVEKLDEHVPIDQPKDPDFLRRVKNFLRRSFRGPIPLGSRRVEWICDCGDLLHMDFNSNSSRSFSTINALLCSQSATLKLSGSSHAPSQPLPGAISMPMPVRSTGNISGNIVTQSGPAPRLHSSNAPQILVGADATASTALTRSNYIFFELCVNAGKLLKTLGEIDVSSINTDGDFFSTVKAHYLRLRSFRARFWLLKPVNVSYVRFSVEDRCRVGILHKPVALPPKAEVDAKRYHYNPCPLENELPISSDLFLHYLFSCSSPSRNLIWLPRIPRKLDPSIFASAAPASFGWGVHIDEGPDYLKVFILNLVILGVSGVAALLWEIFKHDFQAAMGVATWIVMLLNTLMAVFIAKWRQE